MKKSGMLLIVILATISVRAQIQKKILEFQCETGGYYEIQDNNLPWKGCDGFLDAIANWLDKKE